MDATTQDKGASGCPFSGSKRGVRIAIGGPSA
jgi:hypothetical protein